MIPRRFEYSSILVLQFAPIVANEKSVDFEYAGHGLSLRAEVGLSKPFGLFTWETTGEIRNIRLEITD